MSTTSATSMHVVSPLVLAEKFSETGEIPMHLGNYGHINYGHGEFGKLHYPDSNRDGCKRYTKTDFINDPVFDAKDDMRPIGLIEPGGCTHVQKAWNAQVAGLKAAILIEEENDPMALRDAKLHASTDAALGYKLSIPYMKVSADDGKKLQDYMAA